MAVNPSYNYSKLLGRIKERGMTQNDVAAKIDITRPTLSLKLNNATTFKQNEIVQICEVLEIEPEQIGMYFFCH